MTRFWTISLISAGSVATAAVIGSTAFVMGKRSGIKAHAAQQFHVLPDGKIITRSEYNKLVASQPMQAQAPQVQAQAAGN